MASARPGPIAELFDPRKGRFRTMLPCQRQSRTKGRNRRSHDALRATPFVRCQNCGSAKLPHAACNECGYVRPGLKVNLSKED